MLTLETIKNEFAYVKALIGDSEVYQNSEFYEGHGELCDLYFKSINKVIKQEQVDIYNRFRTSWKNYLVEINQFILDTLNSFEKNKAEEINKSILFFEVIEVPFNNFKYDLVLICSKSYKSFLFLKKHIAIRVELKNGKIQTIRKKKDVTEEND